MIRLFRQDARILLVALERLRLLGEDNGTIIRAVTQNILNRPPRPGPDDVEEQVAIAIDSDDLHIGRTLTEVREDLAAQIKEERDQPKADATLIDTLVDVLQLPYLRNLITPEMVKSLRRAILVPSEAMGLAERLRKRESGCVRCGHTFRSHEMAVAYRNPGDEGMVFYCHRCIQPDLVACQHQDCNQAVPMRNAYVRKNVSKGIDCGEHTPAADAANPNAPVVVALNDIANHLEQAGVNPVSLRRRMPRSFGAVPSPAPPFFVNDDDGGF
jgi:hypothetical protein